MNERLIVDLRDRIRHRGYASLPEIGDFKRLTFAMEKDRKLTGEEIAEWLGKQGLTLPKDLPDRITKRANYLVFTPQSNRTGKSIDSLRSALLKRIQKKGGDPYLGQPLAFDYIFCRLGETPYERDTNLVIDLTVLNFSDMASFHEKVWQSRAC